MTKTINIPISSETCHKIKLGIALGLWILATVGMGYVFAGEWFDWFDHNHSTERALYGTFSAMGFLISVFALIFYFHEKGIWLEFRCNCNSRRKKK